uniref:Uncharacterized protein n=1 Tax=Cacopsylla melanoneura TaxID=428564 RepID=A0A8D8YXJ6_9HEMI
MSFHSSSKALFSKATSFFVFVWIAFCKRLSCFNSNIEFISSSLICVIFISLSLFKSSMCAASFTLITEESSVFKCSLSCILLARSSVCTLLFIFTIRSSSVKSLLGLVGPECSMWLSFKSSSIA